jgi:hypothetical protein
MGLDSSEASSRRAGESLTIGESSSSGDDDDKGELFTAVTEHSGFRGRCCGHLILKFHSLNSLTGTFYHPLSNPFHGSPCVCSLRVFSRVRIAAPDLRASPQSPQRCYL